MAAVGAVFRVEMRCGGWSSQGIWEGWSKRAAAGGRSGVYVGRDARQLRGDLLRKSGWMTS